MKTIQELFDDWVDYDVASYYLGCLLGIMRHDDSWDEFRRVKGVFYHDNEGNMLAATLRQMVEVGLLEENDDSQFRWNKSFQAYWLKTSEAQD